MKLLIPEDKANHFIYGLAIFTLGYLAMGFFHPKWAGHAGMLLAAAVGFGKEVYDRRHPEAHTADAKDFFGTVLGGVAGWALTVI